MDARIVMVGVALSGLAAFAPVAGEPAGQEVVKYLPLKKVAPVFSRKCLKSGRHFDYVLVEYDITADGKTENFKIIESSRSCLNGSAIDAAAKFIYQPTTIDGQPVLQRGVRNKFTYMIGNRSLRSWVRRKLQPVSRLIEERNGEDALRLLDEFEEKKGDDLNYFEHATFLRLRGAARIVAKDYVGAREDFRAALDSGWLDPEDRTSIEAVVEQIETRLGD